MYELLRRFVERYGDIFPGTPDAGHFTVNRMIYVSENSAMKLRTGLKLRFNELKRAQIVRVSLVFDRTIFTDDAELQRLFDDFHWYRQAMLETEKNPLEYRIIWEHSNQGMDEAIDWMKEKALDVLNMLLSDYYEIVPR